MAIHTLALALGASFASGLNLYATVAALGLFHRLGVIHLPPALEVLSHPAVLGVAIALYVVEFLADKIPLLDTLWDTAHTFIRPPAGALLAFAAFGQLPEPWRIVAALLAGGLTFASHGAKATTRVAVNASPEPVSNWTLSVAEDVLAVLVVWLAAEHPWLALAVVALLAALAVFLIVKLFGLFKGVLRRALGGNGARPRSGPAAAMLAALALLASPVAAHPHPPLALSADSSAAAAPPATRRHDLPRDVGNGLRNFGSDTWYVASSPARLHRGTLLWVAGVGITTAVLYNNDQVIDDWFQDHEGSSSAASAMVDVGEFIEPAGFIGRTNAIYFAGIGAGYLLRNSEVTEFSTQILESHFLAAGVRNLAKLAAGRTRPEANLGARHFNDQGTSFFSGHTSAVFELATVISHHVRHPVVTVAAYGVASTVIFERLDNRKHWASDCVVGAVVGTVTAQTVIRLHEERAGRVGMAVCALESGPALGVQLRF